MPPQPSVPRFPSAKSAWGIKIHYTPAQRRSSSTGRKRQIESYVAGAHAHSPSCPSHILQINWYIFGNGGGGDDQYLFLKCFLCVLFSSNLSPMAFPSRSAKCSFCVPSRQLNLTQHGGAKSLVSAIWVFDGERSLIYTARYFDIYMCIYM